MTCGASHSESLLDLGSPSGPAPGPGRGSHPSDAQTHPTLPGPADGVRPAPGESGELAVSTTSCGFTATQSCRNRGLQRSTTRSGSGLSNSSSRASQRISDPQRAGQSGIGFKRARDIAAPAHLSPLIAAKPRIQAVIQDAVWAGLLPEQILEACLSEVIETATSTSLSSLDSDEQATAKLYVQKAAQAGNEAWQQTIGGLHGPGVANTPRLRLPG